MKIKTVLIFLSLGALCLAAQDPVLHPTRKYTVGEANTYKLHVTASSNLGELEFLATTKQTVLKVLDNGDAQVSDETLKYHVSFNGSDYPAPQPPVRTVDVDPQGNETGAFNGQNPGALFETHLPIYDHDWKVGDVMNIDEDSSSAKAKIKGTVKYVGVNNGVAEFDADLTVTPDGSDKPSEVKSTTLLDVASNKVSSVDGSIDAMPIQGLELTDVKFHVEREKA